MINTHRRTNPTPRGNRVDPTAVRARVKPTAPCLACVARSRVAQHTCGTQS